MFNNSVRQLDQNQHLYSWHGVVVRWHGAVVRWLGAVVRWLGAVVRWPRRSETRLVVVAAMVAAILFTEPNLGLAKNASEKIRSAQWPSATHDGSRTGTSANLGPTKGHIRWTRRLESDVTPGPAVASDNTIYAASNGGVLHAIDPKNGKDRWAFDGGGFYGNDLSTSPSILSTGIILWPGPNGRLVVLSARGKKLASYEIGGFVLSPAIDVAEKNVYIQSMSGELSAWKIAGNTLKKKWVVDVGGSSYSSPAIAADGTIRTSTGNDLIAVRDDGDKGAELWRYSTEELIEVSPAVGPGNVTIIGSNDPYEYAVNSDGSLRWRFRKDSQTYGSPAATADGKAVFGDHKGRVHTVDITTGSETSTAFGEQKQSRSRSVGVWTSPAIDRIGNIYVGTRLGHIYGFSAIGTRLFDVDTTDTVDSYPALTGDGALIIGSSNGLLYAID
jgi:outer membrane protein assembly factor BamB